MVEASSSTGRGASGLEDEPASHCHFCGKKLDDFGYHFTCHVCGANCCYIHMARYDGAHPRMPRVIVLATISVQELDSVRLSEAPSDAVTRKLGPKPTSANYPDWKHCGKHGLWFIFDCVLCSGGATAGYGG
jgi:hypothetical protein